MHDRDSALRVAADIDKYVSNIQAIAPQALVDAANHLSLTLRQPYPHPTVGEVRDASVWFAEELSKVANTTTE